jgi:hypothetical protein
MSSKPMTTGAFVLKMKTKGWRLCVVKQVPEDPKSCWMLFGQNMKDKTTFQLEFQPHQETTLINHLVNMTDTDETKETQSKIRLVLIRESPEVSHIGTLWAAKGLEMYRKELRTASALFNSLHQDIHMLRLSAQIEEVNYHQTQASHHTHQQSSHCMQTRSKAKH